MISILFPYFVKVKIFVVFQKITFLVGRFIHCHGR
jgi:hypothetical protein